MTGKTGRLGRRIRRRQEIITSSTEGKEKYDRLRAKKTLSLRNTLLTIAILLLQFGYMIPSAFGVNLSYYPIGSLVTGVSFVLLVTIAMVEARVAKSRVATKRIAAGLALMSIFFVSLVVTPGVLPLQWFPPVFLSVLVAAVIGLILFWTGWRKAEHTIRQMAGEYTTHRRGMVWAGTHLTFKARRYHLILAAGMLGALLLFLLSTITLDVIYATGGFLYLIIMVIVAATVKTHQLTKHRKLKVTEERET